MPLLLTVFFPPREGLGVGVPLPAAPGRPLALAVDTTLTVGLPLRVDSRDWEGVPVRDTAAVPVGSSTVPVRRGEAVKVALTAVPEILGVVDSVTERDTRGEALALGQRDVDTVPVAVTVELRVHCVTLGVCTAVIEFKALRVGVCVAVMEEEGVPT